MGFRAETARLDARFAVRQELLEDYQSNPAGWLARSGIAPTPERTAIADRSLRMQPSTTLLAMTRSVIEITASGTLSFAKNAGVAGGTRARFMTDQQIHDRRNLLKSERAVPPTASTKRPWGRSHRTPKHVREVTLIAETCLDCNSRQWQAGVGEQLRREL